MMARPLSVDGAWLIKSDVYSDDRGAFNEWFKSSNLTTMTGETFIPVQANVSFSRAGVIRGIHYSLGPVGQAKLITVLSGTIMDAVIDIRESSPTFGRYATVELNAGDGQAIYLRNNLAHAFQALTDDVVVAYLVSSEYSPSEEREITPLCPLIDIKWNTTLPMILSKKDREANNTIQQSEAKQLPKL